MRVHGGADEADLFQQAALLNDIGNGLHLDAFRLVDVFESIQLAALLVLDDSDLRNERRCDVNQGERKRTCLSEGALADTAKENEMEEVYIPVKVYGLERM